MNNFPDMSQRIALERKTRRHVTIRRAMVPALVLSLALAASVSASDQIYFPAKDNVTNVLVQYINAETVRLDISSWYLSEHSISIAIANRFAAGVPVRIIGDRGAIFEADLHTRAEFYWLANQGIPIRLRYNPTWFPEINHWKAAIFVGQNVVEFGSANFSPVELAPFSSTNYDDETVLFTSDPAIVKAFKTRFDVIWTDTTNEPQSVTTGPYLKNWKDACATEPTGRCDFNTQYPNAVPMVINPARLEPDNPTPPDLIWGQGPDFNNRLTQEILNESARIDIVVYRLGVDSITQALLNKSQAGVPVRVIVDTNQYTNILYPEYWLTHANIDKLWAAGVPIKQRNHQGNTHMKTLITSLYATNASSNFSPNWQRDHDYFVPAATKPAIYQAIADRFSAMWNDTSGFGPLVTTPPNPPVLSGPPNGASAVVTAPTLIWNAAAWAVSYDVYLGTSPSNMPLVGNAPAQLVPSPPSTYAFTPSTVLLAGTTYWWRVVSKTYATPKNPNMIGVSDIWSFTTATGSGGNLPAPWTSQDVGATSAAGSASFANGVFTVSGAGTIWGTSDTFRFVDQSVSGDVTLVARVSSIQNTSTFAKAGIMLRASMAPDAAHVILDVRPSGDLEFMTRSSTGAATTFLATASQAPPAWLRLVRSGTTVTAAVSANGTAWTTVGSTTLNITGSVLAGLVVCSVTNGLNTSTFDNVTVTGGAVGGGLPSPWVNQDVGATGVAGSASFANGVFTVNGAGTIWGNSDTFHFVDQPVSGDVTIVARLTSMQNTSAYAKAGIMLRASTAPDASHVILDVRPTGDLEFMTRSVTGGATTYLGTASQAPPTWIRLVRSGTTVTASVSANGSAWTTIGSTTWSAAATAVAGLVVCSVATNTLNTSTFDSVTVTAGGGPPPPPPPSATDVVIYASDIPASGRRGSWTAATDSTSPNGTKLVTPDAGVSNTASALASPTDYVDVSFSAVAGTPYRIWMRLRALNNSKLNDSLWVQLSDASASGSAAYPIGTTSGLLVNLATDGTGSSLNGWGWQNTAYWLSQPTAVTFSTTGAHTLRIQVREDGVQFDQIVFSPSTYLSTAPGGVSNDSTIVPKP